MANCIVNTDFFVPRGIVIRKDDEKIVIENPGYIRTGKDQMLKGGISDPRNKALMKMFNMIGSGERAGSGVPDIFSVWESNGWITPEIEEQYNPETIQELDERIIAAKFSNTTKERILHLHKVIANNQAFGAKEIRDIITYSDAGARLLIKKMENAHIIAPVKGHGKGKYRFKYKNEK